MQEGKVPRYEAIEIIWVCCAVGPWTGPIPSGPQFPHLLNGVNHPVLSASWVGQKTHLENRWECPVIYNVVIITIILSITLPSIHSL